MRGSGGIYIPYRVYMTGVGDSVKGEETRCTTRFGYGTWSVVCAILGSPSNSTLALGRCP